MPQHVSEGPDFLPRLIRHQDRGQIAQFGCRLTDPFQAAFDCIVSPAVFLEGRQIHTFDIRKDRARIVDNILQAA